MYFACDEGGICITDIVNVKNKKVYLRKMIIELNGN